MSTWTSKVILAALAFGLAACDAAMNVTRSAPMQVQLTDGLIVAGARGWCVDEATSRSRSGTTVIVLGSCAAIADNALLPKPTVEGVLTIAVEAEADTTPDVDSLATFLASPEGRALLARDGQASSISLLEMSKSEDALYLHALDQSGAPRNAAEDYWRALFDIDGRFVTISLITLADSPISRHQGLRTLNAQVDRLKAANAI